jgi:hypothetical protein
MSALDAFVDAHPAVRAELPDALRGWQLPTRPSVFWLAVDRSHQVKSLTWFGQAGPLSKTTRQE